MARKKTNNSDHELNLILLSLRSIRDQVNGELDALEMKIASFLPEEAPREKIRDWKEFLDN